MTGAGSTIRVSEVGRRRFLRRTNNWSLSGSRPHRPMPIAGTGGISRPDKPWIAVLSFANMSGDPDQEYCIFADGMVEEIAARTAAPKLSYLSSPSAYSNVRTRFSEG
jgi:hypothetical protein